MNNKAVVGGDIYARLELCPWLPQLLSNTSKIPNLTHDKNYSLLLTPPQRIQLSNEPVSWYDGVIM